MTDTGPGQFDFRSKYTQSGFIGHRLIGGFFDAVRDLVGGLEIRQAVEIGCGEGFSTERLRRTLPPGVAFEASDVESRLVASAAERNPGVTVTQESVYQLARPDCSVDLVFLLEVLEHLDEPARAMREICRTSRRWAVLSVPREPIWRLLNLLRLRYVTSLGDTPGHVQHWSKGQFIRFATRFGNVAGLRTPLPWTVVLLEVRPAGSSEG